VISFEDSGGLQRLNRIMKPSVLLTLLLLVAVPAFAAKGKREGKRPDRNLTKALNAFDTNDDHRINGEEIAALKKAFAGAPSGPLAGLDKNKDGQIDESEIAAIKLRAPLRPLIAGVDADKNRKIEGAEVEALRKKFEADPKGALSAIDRNSNAKLDDDEIAKMNERLAKHGSKGKGKARPSTPTPVAKPDATPEPAKSPEDATKSEPAK